MKNLKRQLGKTLNDKINNAIKYLHQLPLFLVY
jgi:hypothetical protein